MRHFPLLLLLYVTLDFANPLMPGAVRFEAGSIEVVQGDRTTRAARPMAAPGCLMATFPMCSVVPIDATLHQPLPLPQAVSILAFCIVRRAPPQHRSTPPSPSDDH